MAKPFAVFDADGVFLRTKHPGNYLESHYGLSHEQIARHNERFGEYLVGKADLREELPSFIAEWGLNVSAEDFFRDAFESDCEIDPKVAEAIKTLRKQNVPCGLATNQEKHRMASLDRRFNIRDHFDVMFVSCELGRRKPDKEFFEMIAAQHPSHEFFFWDDRPENVNAARECGWKAFLFVDAATLQADLGKLSTRGAPVVS